MTIIYHNQDYLRIRVTMNYDLSDVATVQLHFNGPNGRDGIWDVVIEDIENGIIYHDVLTGTPLDAVGTWIVWPVLIFNSGKRLPGTPFSFGVAKEGSYG